MSEQPVVVKEVPALQGVGVRRTVAIHQVGELIDEAFASLSGPPAGPPVAVYHDPEFDPDRLDVEVLIPTRSGSRALPAARVAAITHVGPYSHESFSRSYTALFHWLNQQGLQMSGPAREVYLLGPESGKPPAEYVTEIQFPIG